MRGAEGGPRRAKAKGQPHRNEKRSRSPARQGHPEHRALTLEGAGNVKGVTRLVGRLRRRGRNGPTRRGAGGNDKAPRTKAQGMTKWSRAKARRTQREMGRAGRDAGRWT